MRMHNPPGEIIKALCLEPLGVTVTQAAEALAVVKLRRYANRRVEGERPSFEVIEAAKENMWVV